MDALGLEPGLLTSGLVVVLVVVVVVGGDSKTLWGSGVHTGVQDND